MELREFFSEDAWNQMVVKAFFIGSRLWPIQQYDERGNPRLARMLVDLAQERWAAGRPVSGEVWRCVAPHADAEGIGALVRAFETGGERERLSVALALQQFASQRADAAFSHPPPTNDRRASRVVSASSGSHAHRRKMAAGSWFR